MESVLNDLLLTGLIMMGHLQDTTADSLNNQKTLQKDTEIIKDSPWHRGGESMYRKDRYARDRVMKAARLLLPFIKDNETVLDVGCFTQEAKKYYPKWFKYIGIDQKAYHKDTVVVDFNHGFTPIPCKGALCLETLEHLVDPSDTLESIQKSLDQYGHLVVSLPNENTLFHRIRALFGTVDVGCFALEGKHLHLPSLHQSRAFLAGRFEIVSESYYISPTACGSHQEWIGRVLSIIPDQVHQVLADRWPSLFARGFIFLCKHKSADQNGNVPPPLPGVTAKVVN